MRRCAILLFALLAMAACQEQAAQRSPHWPAVRTKHLVTEPACAWCGGTEKLEVHHIKPFHLDRSLELVDSNLITLCEKPGVNCHLRYGHLGNWQRENPDVRRQCEAHRKEASK